MSQEMYTGGLSRRRPKQRRVSVSRPMRGEVLRGQCQGQREDARGGSDEAGWRRRGWGDVWDVKGDIYHLSVYLVNIVQHALRRNGKHRLMWLRSRVSDFVVEGQALEEARQV